jgi:ribose transport system substrate-binding protein
MRPGRRGFRAWRRAYRHPAGAVVGVLLAAFGLASCGGKHKAGGTADPAVRQAGAAVDATPPPLSAYRGPSHGPPGQPPGLVVFVAADPTDGGIADVALGVQQAARVIGWRLQILDGEANLQAQRQALMLALRERPAGIILGGVDAVHQQPALREARAERIPVVGWHASSEPGPDPKAGLFTNVTADPAVVARLAADYAIANSDGTAGVVIFTDSEYSLDTATSDLMASDIRRCGRCAVLAVIDVPVALASIQAVPTVSALLEQFGKRFTYLLAVNGAYINAAQTALIDAGRSGDQPPFSIAAGEGDGSEFARISGDDYQKASVAEPLTLQGWQLIDELNRARARRPPSGYIAPPRLITQSDVPSGGVFDPPSGYRENYLKIWRR